MDAYTGFAYVYDEYMDNIPYEEWGQYMIALLKENGVSGWCFLIVCCDILLGLSCFLFYICPWFSCFCLI